MIKTTDSIRAENLTKKYGNKVAISNVNFSVNKGEVVGFLGPNGAGKSTTLRILCGLIPATSGSAWICGESISAHPNAVKKSIGYMAENNPLPEDMRVFEYLKFRGKLKEIPHKILHERINESLEICDIKQKTQKKIIGVLSKGFKQRVGIADAILARPEVIIMDEPTIGLDPHQILSIRDLINNFRGKMTILLSSHILSEIEVSCDRVIILNHGRVAAHGSAHSLKKEFIKKTKYQLIIKGSLQSLKKTLVEFDSDLVVVKDVETIDSDYRKITLESPNKENNEEQLLTLLIKNPDLTMRSFTRIEPTLEDIFLAATKQSWKESIPNDILN